MLTSNKNNKKVVANNPKPVQFSDFLSFDNIWKLAILAFMVASLYLQNNFITKAEYAKTADKVQKIELILGQLEIKNQIDLSQNKSLELIELRLRQIEQLVAILNSKNEKETKKRIKFIVNSMFVVSVILLTVSFCLFSAKMGFGFKMEPPFCWASFLQMGLFMLSGWAFNKELFYY